MGYVFKGNLFCNVINVISVNGAHISKSVCLLLSAQLYVPYLEYILKWNQDLKKQKSETEKSMTGLKSESYVCAEKPRMDWASAGVICQQP